VTFHPCSSARVTPTPLHRRQKKNSELLGEVKKHVAELRQFFGDTAESKEEDSSQAFFKLITEFADQCTRVAKDLDDWAELVSILPPSVPHWCLLPSQERRQQKRHVVATESGELSHEQIPSSPLIMEPLTTSCVDVFRQYQEVQATSSDDRISSFLSKQMKKLRNRKFR
jgi:hypothetical protein